MPPVVVGAKQRGEFGPAALARSKSPGKSITISCSPDDGDLLVEGVLGTAALADEDHLGRRDGQLRVRVVGFQTISVVGQSMPSMSSKGCRSPLGSGGGPPPNRPAGRLLRHLGRVCGFSTGQGVEEQQRRPALLDVGGQVVDLRLRQRRGLGHEQDVERRRGSANRARPSSRRIAS